MPAITIRGHSFDLPTRYTPGHVLTPTEAHALNGLMAENIRNIMLRRSARFELDEHGHMVRAGEVLRAKDMIAELGQSYTFSPGKALASGARLAKLALELATQSVDGDCKRIGITMEPEARSAAIASVAESQAVMEEAQRRAGLEREAAGHLLEPHA